VVGIVNPTPGSVTVSKSIHSIDVRCTRAGYAQGNGAISSQFQAMTVGNILIGGLVGIVVDAASGAAGTYPGSVVVNLPREGDGGAPAVANTLPAVPGNEAQRAAEISRNYEERIAAARSACSPNAMRACERSITALEAARDAELSELRQLGQAARTGA
jgi:hypothetical protein